MTSSTYQHLNWVQYVTISAPLGGKLANIPYLDGTGATPQYPFFMQPNEQGLVEDLMPDGRISIYFGDGPSRAYTGTPVTWRAHLSLVGIRSDGTWDMLKTYSYGFTIDAMGVHPRPLRQIR